MTFKKITALLLLSTSFYLIADEANLKKMIETSYPKYKVESIKKTQYSGLYEVFMGGQIVYTDEKFSFLIAEGHIVDPKTKKDLTGERLEDLTKIDFSSNRSGVKYTRIAAASFKKSSNFRIFIIENFFYISCTTFHFTTQLS